MASVGCISPWFASIVLPNAAQLQIVRLCNTFGHGMFLNCLLLLCSFPALCSNLVHSFKHAFRPSVRHMPEPTGNQAAPTTHITLHLSQLLACATPEPVDMEVDEPAPGPWPPVGTHLGHLPSHLVSLLIAVRGFLHARLDSVIVVCVCLCQHEHRVQCAHAEG